MDGMYFKNYCALVFGPNKGFKEDVMIAAEGIPEILDGGEFLKIASFSSVLDLDDLESLFSESKLSFVIFEMSPETARGFTINDVMQNRLFDKFFYPKNLGVQDPNKLETIKGMGWFPTTEFNRVSGDTAETIEFEDIDPLPIELYLNNLLVDLEESIKNEEFEKAAKLRDEIKEADLEFYEKNVKDNSELE